MTNNSINLESLNVAELRAITESAQQLITQKQHQRLHDAYVQFEKIAKDNGCSIEEILKAGESLEKNVVLNIVILKTIMTLGQAVVVSQLG